jgi:cytochrome P450
MNQATKGIMLCTDGDEHVRLRKTFAKPLQPKEIADLRPRLVTLAHDKVAELVRRGSLDAVTELAHCLPLTVVTELVGLDNEGRGRNER